MVYLFCYLKMNNWQYWEKVLAIKPSSCDLYNFLAPLTKKAPPIVAPIYSLMGLTLLVFGSVERRNTIKTFYPDLSHHGYLPLDTTL